MANYENIRSYAEFAHTAAAHGGVEPYINLIAKTFYERGLRDRQSIDILHAATLFAGGIIVCGVGRARLKQIKKHIEMQLDHRDFEESLVRHTTLEELLLSETERQRKLATSEKVNKVYMLS